MMSQERVLRILTIRPEDLSRWSKVCRKVNKQVTDAHPEYPRLQHMQLMSYVKRLLPEIRAMVMTIDAAGDEHPDI
jgi:hypothetical protein